MQSHSASAVVATLRLSPAVAIVVASLSILFARPALADGLQLKCNIGQRAGMTDGYLDVHIDFASATVTYGFDTNMGGTPTPGYWTVTGTIPVTTTTDQIIRWDPGSAHCPAFGCPGTINRVTGTITLWWGTDGYVGGPCTAVASPTPKF